MDINWFEILGNVLVFIFTNILPLILSVFSVWMTILNRRESQLSKLEIQQLKKITSGKKLTDEDKRDILQGRFDEISEIDGYGAETIQKLKDIIEDTKFNEATGIISHPMILHHASTKIASTARDIHGEINKVLNDDLITRFCICISPEIRDALAKILYCVGELSSKCNHFDYKCNSYEQSWYHPKQKCGHYARKLLHESIFPKTNVYNKLCHVQNDINKLMELINIEFDNLRESISICKCSNVAEADKELLEMCNDLTGIQQELDTIRNLAELILPEDELPAKT